MLSFSHLKAQVAEGELSQEHIGRDVLTSLKLAGRAALWQWQDAPSLALMGGGAVVLGGSFAADDKLLQSWGKKDDHALWSALDGLAVITNTPILPALFYLPGRLYQRPQLLDFSIELTSAITLASLQSALISHIQVHRRPDESDLSFWETTFRGNSSFPSGHVIPTAVLTYKTFEHFGFIYGLIPLAFNLAISFERIQSRKHYPSDVVGGLLVGILAARSVTRARREYPRWSWLPLWDHERVGMRVQWAF